MCYYGLTITLWISFCVLCCMLWCWLLFVWVAYLFALRCCCFVVGLWLRIDGFGILDCGISGWFGCVCLLFYDCAAVLRFGYLLLGV